MSSRLSKLDGESRSKLLIPGKKIQPFSFDSKVDPTIIRYFQLCWSFYIGFFFNPYEMANVKYCILLNLIKKIRSDFYRYRHTAYTYMKKKKNNDPNQRL